MASEACEICGDEVDSDEFDPCGHFDTSDIACLICGERGEDHPSKGHGADHDHESGI